MDLRKLEIFEAVYRTGTVTGAADQLWMAQPSVTLAMKELESELATLLFDRQPRGMAPTEAAHILHEYARQMTGLEQQAKFAIAEWSGLQRGRLRIGASTTIAQYVLPRSMGQFSKQYPAIELSLAAINSSDVVSGVKNGDYDLGFIEGFLSEESVTGEEFLSDQLLFVASLATARSVRNQVDLQKLHYVSREPGSGTKEIADQAIAKLNLQVARSSQMNSAEAIKRFLMASPSFAILSQWAVSDELALGNLCTLAWPKTQIDRKFRMIVRKNRSLPPSIPAFQEILSKYLVREKGSS